jgi:hypothetical protein
MNIKIILMLAGIVLVASVATMTIVSNPAFAVKHPHLPSFPDDEQDPAAYCARPDICGRGH